MRTLPLAAVLLGACCGGGAATRAWPPSGYQLDPDWNPSAPAALGVTGVSAVACLTRECPEVYVAQRGGSKPIVVLDSKTGAFLRAFGDNATAGPNASLFGKIHGLRAQAHGPVPGANLWATDAGSSRILGFNAGTGELVTSFGSHGTGAGPQLQFGNVADLAFSQNGTEMFVADGDGGINARVSRLTATPSGAWATTWVTTGDKYNSPSNFSSPHSVAYDACWDAVFVADRNHQRVVQLQGRLGTGYTPSWDLKCLLGYHFDNISDPSSYAVWSVRTSNTMNKDHVGKLFVGIGSLKSPPEMGYIAVMNLADWSRPCGSTAGDQPPCRKDGGQINDVFEIGHRFPHEIEVAFGPDGVTPGEYVYVAEVDSHDPEVGSGIKALTRWKAL